VIFRIFKYRSKMEPNGAIRDTEEAMGRASSNRMLTMPSQHGA
jgi:hypothetical protein